MDVRTKIYEIVRTQGDLSEGDIKAESTPDTLGLDELDIVEINMAIEETFDIILDEEDFPEWKTVDDLVSYVETKIKK